jgi:hypothetical protein
VIRFIFITEQMNASQRSQHERTLAELFQIKSKKYDHMETAINLHISISYRNKFWNMANNPPYRTSRMETKAMQKNFRNSLHNLFPALLLVLLPFADLATPANQFEDSFLRSICAFGIR